MSSSKPKTEREKMLEEMEKKSSEAINISKEDVLFHYKGVPYPTYLSSIETFQALQTLEAREDDMMIVTYPKCGTNWMMQILHEVLYLTHNQEPTLKDTMLEFGKPDKLEFINSLSSPRIFSTHMYYSDLPKSFFEKKAKILVILRNPKDTAASFYHFCNNLPVLPTYSSWDAYFQDFMNAKVCYGSYFDHVLSWNEHMEEENIMAVTYEDLKEDFAAQLKKITEFLGLDLTKDHITEVENKTTFKAMKEKSQTTHGVVSDAMFRKGEIGDWRSHFTEEQSKEVDAKFEQLLAGTTLGKKINYKKYCMY